VIAKNISLNVLIAEKPHLMFSEKALIEHYKHFDTADIIYVEKPDGRGALIAVERDATGNQTCSIMGVPVRKGIYTEGYRNADQKEKAKQRAITAIEKYFTEQRGELGIH
jgi:hypothetical protein